MSDFGEGAIAALLVVLAAPVLQQVAWGVRKALNDRKERRRFAGQLAYSCGHTHPTCGAVAPVVDWVEGRAPTCRRGAGHDDQHESSTRSGILRWSL